MNTSTRTKLTLSVDPSLIKEVKKMANRRRIPISRLVENFLRFLTQTEVYCFKCGEKFQVRDAKIHPRCDWLQCTKCKACGCGLDEETASAVYYMRRTFEDLLGGRVKVQ